MNALFNLLNHAAQAPEPDTFRLRRERLAEQSSTYAPAAVLVGFCGNNNGSVILTVRSASLRQHKSQISFPGGRCDPTDPHPCHTALRETEEELGIAPSVWHIHGQMPECYLPSGYRVMPILASTKRVLEFQPNPDEVAAVFTLPYPIALNPKAYTFEHYQKNDIDIAQMPVLQHQQYRIWGATATILYELALLSQESKYP